MLLAASSVHQHLVRNAKRTRIGLVVETGEASEVHHHCLLLGYGVDAVNPYLVFEASNTRYGFTASTPYPSSKQ